MKRKFYDDEEGEEKKIKITNGTHYKGNLLCLRR